MLGYIPVFILLGAAIVIFVLQFVPRSTGIAWFASVIFSIAAWVMVIILHTNLPFSFSGMYWIPLGVLNLVPALQIDIITWPFVLSICSLTVAILFAASTRIGLDSTPREWAVVLIFGALGYLGVTSSNILTAMLVLGGMDILEVVIILFDSHESDVSKSNLNLILWRFAGLLMFLFAYGWQVSNFGMSDEWRTLQSVPALIILVAVAFRLRVVPFNLKNIGPQEQSHNGLFVIRILSSSLVIFAVIIQLPFYRLALMWKSAILIYLFITTMVVVIRLLRPIQSKTTAHNWIVAAGSLICAAYILGFPSGGIVLAVSSTMLGASILLDYPNNKLSKILGVLAVITFSGLPYTPNVAGLNAFGLSLDFPAAIFIIPVAFLLFSSIRILFEKNFVVNPNAEKWTNILAPVGFVFTIFSSWINFVFGFGTQGGNLISIAGLLASFICMGLFVNNRFNLIDFSVIRDRMNQSLPNILLTSGNRFYSVINVTKSLFVVPIQFISNLFEGEGGVLWSVLSLVLIITVIRTLGLTP